MYEYINFHRTAAEGPWDQKRWMTTIDLITASRLYDINIIQCEKNPSKAIGEPSYSFRVFSPDTVDGSVFLYIEISI